MQSVIKRMETFRRNGMLYPMLIVAALFVTIFSAFGVATMAGWLTPPP